MSPPSRRRVLPSKTLAAFDAAPLYPASKGVSHGDDSSQTSPLSVSRAYNGGPSQKPCPTPVRVMASKSSPPARDASSSSAKIVSPNGLMIGGWRITSQNSTIGDETSMEELTSWLEEAANDTAINGTATGQSRRKRRLCPPEITFLNASISLQYQYESNSSNNAGEDGASELISVTELRFTARDALLEWAEAHRCLETTHDQNGRALPIPSRAGVRGVSILRTVDAKTWSNKPRALDAPATPSNSEFYYDWTFSSPYAGTIRHSNISEPNGVDAQSGGVNNRRQWQSLEQSRIPFHMLQDTSQPILLFDDVHLYEDDLHDNGDVSLNIKIRVMPRCWYVLQRLFVRVDHVCVKCREVRYFCLLHGGSKKNTVRPNVIYRDVTWREAAWAELSGFALPTDPSAWRETGNVLGGATAPGMQTPPPLASLLTRLPVVKLPDDLPKFSYFEVPLNADK